jgi:hypothetical protein
MHVVLIDKPSVIREQIVWVAKDEGEDWTDMVDDVYRYRYIPNRVCVIVTTTEHETFSDWMQVRNHHYGDPSKPDQEHCSGTTQFSGRYPDYAPNWLIEARDTAVRDVREEA